MNQESGHLPAAAHRAVMYTGTVQLSPPYAGSLLTLYIYECYSNHSAAAHTEEWLCTVQYVNALRALSPCWCTTLPISPQPRRLSCFTAFFPFWLWLKEQQAVTAPWALTDHSLRSGWQRCRRGSATLHKGAAGGWSCSAVHTVKQPPPLLRACYSAEGCPLSEEVQMRRGRTWIHAGLLLDVSCDHNTGSLLSNSNRETLAKICLSRDLILNKLPWSFLYCNILFGKSWDCWVNSVLQGQYVCSYRLFRYRL